MCIAETELDELFPNEQFILEAYRNPYRLDITDKKCGLMVFVKLGVAFIPKLPRETWFQRSFFRPTHPGKKRRAVADTCRQGKTIKALATDRYRLLQL